MPYGMQREIRQAFLVAKPWQRYVICILMIAGGVGLAFVGHLAGLVISFVGILMIWKMLAYRLRMGRGQRERSPELDDG